MNDDVKQFRWREALKTLADCSKALKEYNPDLEITCCVHATKNTYYVFISGCDEVFICCVQPSSGCGRQVLFFLVVPRLGGRRDPPAPGLQPVSSPLTGRFLTTGSPGKSRIGNF